MIHRIVVQPRAERDIREAARFILEESKSRAKALQWAQDVRAKIDTLQANPERCPVDIDSDAHGREVRVLLFGKRRGVYRILFVIDGGVVHVKSPRREGARRGVGDRHHPGRAGTGR